MFTMLTSTWRRVDHSPLATLTGDLAELQIASIELFAGAAAVLATCLLLCVSIWFSADEIAFLAIALMLYAICALTWACLRRHVAAAAFALITGLLIVQGLAIYLFPFSLVPLAACLVALVAVFLLGGQGGFVAAVARRRFQRGQSSSAAAVAWVLFAVILVFVVHAVRLASSWVQLRGHEHVYGVHGNAGDSWHGVGRLHWVLRDREAVG